MTTSSTLTLLLGGARSGKSRYAEQWAKDHGGRVLFVATAEALDDEMAERIAAHRATRPALWHTLEAPRNTAQAMARTLQQFRADVVVVDCMTLLASNTLLDLPDNATAEAVHHALTEQARALVTLFGETPNTQFLVVSNEVGMGVVPPTRLGRLYQDGLGAANQVLAAAADHVLLFVAGLAWQLKSPPTHNMDKRK
ncbi:MAG: bifunctional adenosylcobinamide kinase/adenosylcobinamide-phosphate guanylyltransferase [Phototrophicaceae bacterium]